MCPRFVVHTCSHFNARHKKSLPFITLSYNPIRKFQRSSIPFHHILYFFFPNFAIIMKHFKKYLLFFLNEATKGHSIFNNYSTRNNATFKDKNLRYMFVKIQVCLILFQIFIFSYQAIFNRCDIDRVPLWAPRIYSLNKTQKLIMRGIRKPQFLPQFSLIQYFVYET